MTLFRRKDTGIQLIYDHPEKMNHTKRMFKYTDYKDMTIIISIIGNRGLRSKIKIRFGKGWMGKGATIMCSKFPCGNLRMIAICVTAFAPINIFDCWLESPEGRTHLDPPVEIQFSYPQSPEIQEEWEYLEVSDENAKRMRSRRRL